MEELTKMGGAMRTVLTKILTNQQTFKELCMGKSLDEHMFVMTKDCHTTLQLFFSRFCGNAV